MPKIGQESVHFSPYVLMLDREGRYGLPAVRLG